MADEDLDFPFLLVLRGFLSTVFFLPAGRSLKSNIKSSVRKK